MISAYVYCKLECVVENIIEAPPTGSPLAGAPFRASVKDETIKEIAHNFSMSWNQNSTNTTNFFRVSCITRATSQVVAGYLYNLTVTLSETSCNKELFVDVNATQLIQGFLADECPYTNNELECWFQLYTQPWLYKTELTDYECEFKV
jgi:hypothetical protein